jgi:MATE family, multidrug efflux pump
MTRDRPAPVLENPASRLLSSPILPTLVRLSLPNTLTVAAAVSVGIAETIYIAKLGASALAGMAIAFPIMMMQLSLANGAMGGGISSAISRALGAGDQQRAGQLALHGLAIGFLVGLSVTVLMLLLGPAIYFTLGARDSALAAALHYSNVVYLGAVPTWLFYTLISIVRGSGSMMLPAAANLGLAIIQISLGASLALGLGPFPRLGMAGVATGHVIALATGVVLMFAYLLLARSPVPLPVRGFRPKPGMLLDILKVGALSCVGPIQTNMTVIVTTGVVASFGTLALAGYGIGARLEMLLVNVAFGIGVASVPLVGMAIGNGDGFRAKQVAWTAGACGAVVLGMIGAIVSTWPAAWSALFTTDPAVQAHTVAYLTIAGPAFAALGLGFCLFFASQGSGKVLATVFAGTLRLAAVAVGAILITRLRLPLEACFVLVAIGMAVFGLAAGAAVYKCRWA